ncbi:hypothetical protein E2C01_015620 [Portunus trituberculatus]|uniref:Uncharacterized protein n=1 Tax=Portunus trituberculatus TaxID=210409 RepID=A0A5B7DNI8_PORTR|nr:hypothetical protein [Portunus trituberculatus]
MGGGRRCQGTTSCRVFLLAAVVLCCVGSAAGICVVDNKKGWFVSCGVRDSYLFRLKDYGGINANFDFSKCACNNSQEAYQTSLRRDCKVRENTSQKQAILQMIGGSDDLSDAWITVRHSGNTYERLCQKVYNTGKSEKHFRKTW